MTMAARVALLAFALPSAAAWSTTNPARLGASAPRVAPSRARVLCSAYPEVPDFCIPGYEVSVPTWNAPSREEMMGRLESEEFDLLVIGGGASGAGVAMDAATRGLKVALVERGDFGSATSSRSTKLIHGGLRYLAQAFQSKLPPSTLLEVFQNLHFKPEYLGVVAADLSERAYMIKSAPFMATALPMMVPLYRWWEIPMFFVVGKLYDLIAGRNRAVPPSRVLSREEALFEFPGLALENEDSEPLIGSLVIYDGQQNDARMGLHIILTAIEAGASCVNYAEVQDLLHEGGAAGEPGARLVGARIRDRPSGRCVDVRAKQVVNACGVYSDAVRLMAQPGAAPIMVPAYGTHVVLPELSQAVRMGLVWFTKDGRVLYLLPWLGQTLAGTTDLPGPISFEPEPTQGEVDFILTECNRVLMEPLDPARDVRAAWAGIRPLVRDPSADPADTKKLSRDHVIDVAGAGLVTLAGGKWTTYRKMAEDAVDACVQRNPALAHAGACVTPDVQLVGTDRMGEVCGGSYDRIVSTLRDTYEFDRETARHLRINYGTRALQIAELVREEQGRFCAQAPDGHREFARLAPSLPQLEAEVAFACRYEFALTAIDVLAHRTRIAFLDSSAALKALPRVLAIMQRELGWDDARVRDEAVKTRMFLAKMALPKRRDGMADQDDIDEATSMVSVEATYYY